MTGYLWAAQDPGSMRRAKTGYGVQAETVHVPDVLRYSGIAPSRRVCVCLPRCSVCLCSKCMRDRDHAPQRGFRRSGSAGPAQPQRCGDGEDRDPMP